jgi:hypothetical protein
VQRVLAAIEEQARQRRLAGIVVGREPQRRFGAAVHAHLGEVIPIAGIVPDRQAVREERAIAVAVEPPVRQRPGNDDLPGRTRHGNRDRVEAGEPLSEVEGNREVVDVGGELDFLALQQVQGFVRPTEYPGGHGLHVDGVARQVEMV